LPDDDRHALFELLESPGPRLLADGLEALRPGKTSGPLLGGNLEVLSRLLGTGLLPDLDGAVLVLEEIGERPYRLDRLLCHLELAGVFARVAAVVVGELLACEEPSSSPLRVPTALGVVRERLARLPIPVALGLPVGHGRRNRALPHGARVELDTAAGTLTALEGAVS
jgi:muramoyltetrapeptide carboxypeptidase